VLAAPARRLRTVVPDNGAVARHIGAVRGAVKWALRSRLDERPILSTGRALFDYLRLTQGFEQVEMVRLLYLDVSHRLIREEVVARGTVDEAPIYVREIVRRALEVGACGLIMVHNHPSGDASPSSNDVAMTRRLQEGARTMGLILHDHLIVSANGCTSMRAESLI
jgi:DNA repair protein RadC